MLKPGWEAGHVANIAVSLCLVFTVAAGCSRWVVIHDAVERVSSNQISVPALARVPLVLRSIQINRNGSAQNPQLELDRRLLTVLEETNLFSTLYHSGSTQPPTADDRFVTARLTLNETIEPHAGGAAWRGLVIGASMFTLTPMLPLEYDYGSELVLDLTRWDGQSKQYRAASSGTARYHLFGATPVAIEELKGQVLERALVDLTHRLVLDSGFVLIAEQFADSPESQSIVVKARKAGPRFSSETGPARETALR